MAAELIATLGPASLLDAPALVAAGATALRLNASHILPEQMAEVLRKLRLRLPRTLVIVDLQGAKMRLGAFEERAVAPGETYAFASASVAGAVPVPHPELFRSATLGETLSIDDDRLRFRVTAVSSQSLHAKCLVGGMLRQAKGINVVEHPVALDDLTERDQQHIAVAMPYGPIAFAVSFMTDGREAQWVRPRAPGCPVLGKIERREAIEQVEAIAGCVDGLWICRGDLGAQLGSVTLARWFSAFTPLSSPPTLLAGQVLEHLTSHDTVTRSEVCHLYDILARGYAGIVLSDETAIGADPVNAVQTAAGLLEAFSPE